jgi:hypothetical protein
MWKIDTVQIQALSFIHRNIYRTCFQKLGLLEDPKGRGEKEKNDRE